MANRNWALVAAVLASSTLAPQALAANARDARNWGGLWLGFSAGYAGTSARGSGLSSGCLTSSVASGDSYVAAKCFEDKGGEPGAVTLAVARDGDATAVGENRSLTGATAFDSSNISSADLSDGSASVVAIAVGLAGATDPGEAITDTGINLNSREATLRAGAKSTDDVPNATVDTDISLDGEPHSQGSIQVSGLAISNSVSGMSVTASYSSASLGDSSAEALAINFGGLPGGDISGSDGGLAVGIHLRYDFQGQNNWVLGAELNLTAPNDSGASSSDTSTFGFTANAYPRTDLNINRAISLDTSVLASARLRLGYAMGDYLAFVTGGVAYARYDVTSTMTGTFDGARASETATASGESLGGVIGGGFSAFVADNATISIEGLYYTFGGDDVYFDNGMSAGLNDAFSLMTTFSIRAN